MRRVARSARVATTGSFVDHARVSSSHAMQCYCMNSGHTECDVRRNGADDTRQTRYGGGMGTREHDSRSKRKTRGKKTSLEIIINISKRWAYISKLLACPPFRHASSLAPAEPACNRCVTRIDVCTSSPHGTKKIKCKWPDDVQVPHERVSAASCSIRLCGSNDGSRSREIYRLTLYRSRDIICIS